MTQILLTNHHHPSQNWRPFATSNLKLNKLTATLEAERCLLCVDAPCAKACPADTRPDKFIRQLRFENPLGGAETILDNNPLGGICGTVCPVSRLCEAACTRKEIDKPVKIGAIQAYLHEVGLEAGLPNPPAAPKTGHKCAVIGAGPSGLSCARELARRGSEVTIFEKHQDAGGALIHALSPVRVNHDEVSKEIERITKLGVRFQFETTISDPSSLLSQGFDDVYISPGLQANRDIGVKTTNGKGNELIPALQFLSGANAADATPEHSQILARCQGKSVVVIGGGSVAMDCAVTAKSFGASRVYIVSLEALEGLPADEEEIELARLYGAIFLPETRVVEVNSANNMTSVKVESITKAVVQLNKDSGDAESHILASTIVVAAGQVLDENGKRLLSLDGYPNQTLVHTTEQPVPQDIRNNSMNKKKIYVGGDAVRGKGDTVVAAVSDGKRAAAVIVSSVQPPQRLKPSLETEFCGIKFENPFCLSSSPVTNSAEMIAMAYDLGWSGSYYKTLNREDKFAISHPSPRLGSVHTTRASRMDVGIQNMEQISDRPLADNLADIRWLRKNYPNKVMGVSIMGYNEEDWAYLAKAAEDSGAHLLELNFSCPQMARPDAGHHIGQQFSLIEKYTAATKRAVSIPVIAKMTPNITDMLPAALAAQEGGADGISAINTVRSISHLDLYNFTALPVIQGKSAISGFSGKGCRHIGLRFVSELSSSPQLRIPVSGMGGIYSWKDGLEYLQLGASNLQVTTSVMQHGYRIVEDMIGGLEHYLMDGNGSGKHKTVQEIIGKSLPSLVEPGQLDSLQTEVVSSIDPNICIGCGICEVACRDGAAQAISLQSALPSASGGKRLAVVDEKKCVGCELCDIVCPVGAISFTTRPRIPRERFSKEMM
jgi:dihydropyrimidine dehydrogenase (NAD+) subunit PreA